MPTRAAGGHDDAIDGAELLRREVEAAEDRRGGVPVEPATHGILDRFRLLEDLLEHEVREAALGDVAGVKIQHVNAVVDVPLVAVNHPQAVGRHHRQFMVGQIDDLVGVAGQG